MDVTYGFENALSDIERQRLFAYRYAVFVQRLGWALPQAQNGLEIDQFDRSDTIHVVARNTEGDICGCARLLPTSRPYLLSEVFPQLMGGRALPSTDEVWELSRFSATDLIGSTASPTWLCREVMAATIACAMEVGAKRLIAVTSRGVERILCRLGMNWQPIGVPMKVGGDAIFAFFVEIDEITIAALSLEDRVVEMKCRLPV